MGKNLNPRCFPGLWICLCKTNCKNTTKNVMMMNCLCGMVDLRKEFTPYFQPGPLSEILVIANLWHAASRAPNLSSDFVEWSCAVVIATAPRRHIKPHYVLSFPLKIYLWIWTNPQRTTDLYRKSYFLGSVTFRRKAWNNFNIELNCR